MANYAEKVIDSLQGIENTEDMTLAQRMQFYRDQTNYKLEKKTPIIINLDGRSFSKYCKQFNKPFDREFVALMNYTAEYLVENISGARFAYVQSDEISIYVIENDTEESEPWFGNRLLKFVSLSAAMATGYFNRELISRRVSADESRMGYDIYNHKLAEFDSRAWNVPELNDVFAWFLYRQIDCVRSSKNMTARTYFSHRKLDKLTIDQQISLLKIEEGIDWNEFDEGWKYGRFVYKQRYKCYSEKNVDEYCTGVKATAAFDLTNKDNQDKFIQLLNDLRPKNTENEQQ
jgi:tRNA(His) 5'-end guanylyltransferase